jgi:ADP-heptose:LPS heptosyltransferase
MNMAVAQPAPERDDTFAGIVRAAEAPMLIAVGGGVGDMLHCTPMIRNISRRLGVRVDLAVSEEYPKNLFLLHNPKYVNAVYGLRQVSLARRYDTIFATHFFGEARVPFRARRVVWSRSHDKFRVGRTHETIFNLESARELLGIPYDEDDVAHYFLGDFHYLPPKEMLVGLHAGCKTGHWVSKRWPFYSALVQALQARNIRIASFGTEDEYVDGTENLTGGSIREMAERMLACSHFIANDSGVMNMANALGIPLLAIFGPTDAKTLLPLRPSTRAVALEKICAPCHQKNPPHFAAGACRCIGDLSLDAVAREVDAFLAGEPRERITYLRADAAA